jgi:hypothetical protein
MKNNNLNQVLGSFEASYIQKLDVDLLNKKISLTVLRYNNENPENHAIVFRGVSAFYFSNGSGDLRFNTEPWELIELSGIGYYQPSRDHITCINDTPGTLPRNSDPNFNLDIWGTVFLIEAKEVVIDDVIFQA